MFLAHFELDDSHFPGSVLPLDFMVETARGEVVTGTHASVSLIWEQELPGNTALENKPIVDSVAPREIAPGHFQGAITLPEVEGYYNIHVSISRGLEQVIHSDLILVEAA